MISVFNSVICGLGEGLCVSGNSVWWVDINTNSIYTYSAGAKVKKFQLPLTATTILSHSNHIYIVTECGISKLEDDYSITSQANVETLNSETRSNDACVLSDGSIIMGTMGRYAEKGVGSIYWINGASVNQVDTGYSIPNGFALSHNEEYVLISDSTEKCIYRYEIDCNKRKFKFKELFLNLKELPGNPDGMQMCSDDSFWVAMWGQAELIHFSHSGGIIRKVPIPALNPTNCKFFDLTEKSLLITTATYGMSKEEISLYPLSGKLLKVEL